MRSIMLAVVVVVAAVGGAVVRAEPPATPSSSLPPPIAGFSWSPAAPVVGEIVKFRNQTAGYAASWGWDLGDTTTSIA